MKNDAILAMLNGFSEQIVDNRLVVQLHNIAKQL